MAIDVSCLSTLIKKGDKVMVGLSGGADSMCLLDLVAKFNTNLEFDFFAVHINHGLRDLEAQRDQDFVVEYCQKNKIKIICKNIKTKEYARKNNKTIEQAGRELRYKTFKEVLENEGANKLLVAHHKNDQVETVLMHICRGSSLSGARGMELENNKVVRPLLNYTRAEIEGYIQSNNIPFIEDSSNSDINYTRNYIRHNVLPNLEKIWPNVVNSIANFAEKVKEEDDYIDSLVPVTLLVIKNTKVTIKQEAEKLKLPILLRLIRKAFESLGKLVDIEKKHLLQVVELFVMKNGSQISLPNGLVAFKEYNGVVIAEKSKNVLRVKNQFVVGCIEVEGFGQICCQKIESEEVQFGNGCHYVDLDKIPVSAIWRTRADGDVFAKLGSGTKKLNDYFIDKKISKQERDSIPILCDGNKVLVVAGYDVSENVKIDSSTDNIVKITYNNKI